MSRRPRILTFNFHEPYLCLMAKTGLRFDIGVYESGPMRRVWQEVFRPIPGNLRLLPERAWREGLRRGEYDVLIAHNEMNALDVRDAPCAKLLVCHNRRTFLYTTASAERGDPVEAFDRLLAYLQPRFEFIFISDSKRDDYGIPGRVILPGIDVDDHGGYRGEERRVLRVGNTMRQRNRMFDVDLQEAACENLPCLVLGHNPEIPASRPSRSFEELLEAYRSNRCLLHVTREEYEDGYNLSTLEAMATGMPVVSLANATSPLTHGVDGLIGRNADELRAHLNALLDDLDHARELGRRGRETVAVKFPIARFVEQWRETIFAAADAAAAAARPAVSLPANRKLRVLLHYNYSPITTGRWVEEALRAECDVLTVGMRMPEEVLRLWGFPEPIPAYRGPDLEVPHNADYETILRVLPKDYMPDLYLYVDSGHDRIEPGIEQLGMPRVAWLIDAHVSPESRLEMARHFDVVFVAQKAYAEKFRAAGLDQVHWLPLGCAPRLHHRPEVARDLDVAFVGSLSSDEGFRRRKLIHAAMQNRPNHFLGKAWPEDMAAIYARAKIVVNAAYKNDVNMRVFEALASGALLVTDPAAGLEDLFCDGEHLVIYRNDAAIGETVERYLADTAARARIAAAGRQEVLARHTYAHRVEELIARTRDALKKPRTLRLYAEKQDAYYACPRRELAPFVPLHTRRLLDVGCGAGALAGTLKREMKLEAACGIEIVESACAKAREVLDTVLLGNLETMELPFPEEYFDCIICGDVLEHLVEPAQALRKLAAVLAPEGQIVISIPNIQYYDVLAMLSEGRWTYAEAGLLDATHLRFFTKTEVEQLIADAGLETVLLQPLNMRPADKVPLGPRRSLKMGKVLIENLSDEEYERFLVYQWLAIAGKPGADRLAPARRAYDRGAYDAAFAVARASIGVPAREQQMLMARSLAKLGRLTEAQAIYRYLRENAPGPEVDAELGIVLVAMGQAQEALPLLERSRKSRPEDGRIAGALGLALLRVGRRLEALATLRFALETTFEHAELLPHAVALARELGRVQEVEPILRAYADFYPANAEVACMHAEVLCALDRKPEARNRLEMLLLLSPTHAHARALAASLQETEN